MQLCPIYPAWYPYGLAVCFWMQQNFDEAFTYIEEAIRIDPGLSLNYLVLIMLYQETDQPLKVKECVDQLFKADPGFSASTFIEAIPFGDPVIAERRRGLLMKAGLIE